jgi:enoyl-CoA hydratase/carnithine racemase
LEEIELEIDDPVAIIRMNRPDALNALTDRGWNELRDAFADAEADSRVVGIILTGAGRGFCAGYDLSNLDNAAAGGSPDVLPSARVVGDPALDQSSHDPAYISAVRKPVIAAVNGPAAGGGMALALWCDIRIASESAVLTTQFPKLGLTSESGSGWILPRIVGTSKALDLLWTGRKVRAEEAERIGLVDRMVPDDQLIAEARGYIESLAKSVAPWSLMEAKRMVYRGWEQGAGVAIEESDRQATESFNRPDVIEGTKAFAEKRAPRFERLEFDS